MTTTWKGLKFPFQRDATGFPAVREGTGIVEDQVRSLFYTGKGERVMRPTLGVAAPEQIFGEISQIQKARLAADSVRVMREFVPLASLRSVDVHEGNMDNDKSTLYADIAYGVAGQDATQQVPMATGAQG
jgi:phage baseplate assembly protein W